MATHSSMLAWRIPRGLKELDGTKRLHFHFHFVAQLVKNPPAVQETPIQFLGQEDPLEKG